MNSIADQASALKRLVEAQGLNVIHSFEESHSAKKPYARPLFDKMLSMVANGEADAILCWHLNRLSRNPVDSGQLAWMLQQGIIQCIKTVEREYRPEDNVVIMAVENAVANQFILDHRKNIRRTQDEKAARGWFPHTLPVGYLWNRETKEIDIDPVRFPLLRRAWDLLLTGSYLVPEVLDKLTEWGYLSRKSRSNAGKPMARNRFYVLFDNPFYYGEFTYQGERHIGRHQPMVTREEFERVQAIIHRNYHIQPQRHSFAFTGLIRCGGCAAMVTAERKIKSYRTTGRIATYEYYRCTRRKPCHEPAATESYIVQEIQDRLNRCHLDEEIAAWARQAIDEHLAQDAPWAPPMVQQHQGVVDDLESKLKRLLEMRLSNEISADDYRSRKGEYEADLQNRKSALDRLNNREETTRKTLDNYFRFVTMARDAFIRADHKTQRHIAARLAEAYVLTLGKLEITLHPLLAQLYMLEPPKSGPHQVQRAKVGPTNPQLCTLVDNIITLLRDESIAFEQIELPNQVGAEHGHTPKLASTLQHSQGVENGKKLAA